jgi:D-amino-acid oxidase
MPRSLADPPAPGAPALPGRRALLGALALAGTGLLLPGCAARAVRGGDAAPGLRLAMPDLRPELVIRDVAGLRPFRPQGFRVEAERLGDTLLIHNYGHGGCGVTLSWGTAKLALDIALAQPHRRAAVIGCGAVGLATARLFQDHGFEVSIHARELPPDTTSNIAGALWAPSYLLDREHETDAFGAQLAAASRYAHRYFQLLPDVRYGIAWTRMFMFGRSAEAGLSWDWAVTPELFASVAHAPGSHPFGARWLHEYRLMMIEPSIYLPAVIDAFRLAGGTIHVHEVPDLDALRALAAPVVVNCTGLGARALVGDTTMTPIRGQLRVLAPQPAIDYGVIGAGLYLFPRRDGLILGGTRDRDDWSTTPDPDTAARLLAGHRELFGA